MSKDIPDDDRDDDIRDDERRPRRRSRRRDDDDDDYDDRRPRRGEKNSNSLVIVLIVVGVLVVCGSAGLIGLLLPAVAKVREAASRAKSSNDMKNIAIGMINYADANNGFPTAAIRDKNGKSLLSWRVAILPYIEQQPLYAQFRLDEPWDGPNNIRLLSQMPKIYGSPNHMEAAKDYKTPYRVFQGKGTLFDGIKPVGLNEIKDGAAGTILIAEATESVPWSKPEELEYDPTRPLPSFGAPGSSWFLFAMADGSVRKMNRGTSDQNIRAGILRNDGVGLITD